MFYRVPVILCYFVIACVTCWIPFILMEDSFWLRVRDIRLLNLFDHEQAREVGGLLLVLTAMIYLIFRSKNKSSSATSYVLFAFLLPALVAAVFAPKLFKDFSSDSHCNGMFMET